MQKKFLKSKQTDVGYRDNFPSIIVFRKKLNYKTYFRIFMLL